MAIKKDLGLVLRTFDFRETSKIAHIFTQRLGKIHGLFKGFRTGKKNFTTTLDVFSLNEFVLYESKNEIWLVSFADIIDQFEYLKTDLEKNFIANYIVELVDKVVPLHYSSEDIFNLIKDSFFYLKDHLSRKILYIFQIRMLELSGFKPHLTSCIKCAQDINDAAYFSVTLGGFLCPDCADRDRFAQAVTKELISCLQYIQNHDFKMSLRLTVSDVCERKIFGILEEFLGFHLNTKIKSLSSIGFI